MESRKSTRIRSRAKLADFQQKQLDFAVASCLQRLDSTGFRVDFIDDYIGKGVFTEKTFKEGAYLLEYAGDLLTYKQAKSREKLYNDDPKTGSFMYYFRDKGKTFCVDATNEIFSKGRMVNDCPAGEIGENAKMKIVMVDKRPHLCLFATKDIDVGQEIRYDYGVKDLPWRQKQILTTNNCSNDYSVHENGSDTEDSVDSANTDNVIDFKTTDACNDDSKMILTKNNRSNDHSVHENGMDTENSVDSENTDNVIDFKTSGGCNNDSNMKQILTTYNRSNDNSVHENDKDIGESVESENTDNVIDFKTRGSCNDDSNAKQILTTNNRSNDNKVHENCKANVESIDSENTDNGIDFKTRGGRKDDNNMNATHLNSDGQHDHQLQTSLDTEVRLRNVLDTEDLTGVCHPRTVCEDDNMGSATSDESIVESSGSEFEIRKSDYDSDSAMSDIFPNTYLRKKAVSRPESITVGEPTPKQSVSVDTSDVAGNSKIQPSVDTPVSKIIVPCSTKGLESNNKLFYCMYCSKPFKLKIKRHLETQHADESEVAELLAEPNKQQQRKLLEKIRNLGNHLHNCDVLRKGEGELAVRYRPTVSDANTEDYGPCPYCYGYFVRLELWRHDCHFKPSKDKAGIRIADASKLILPNKLHAS